MVAADYPLEEVAAATIAFGLLWGHCFEGNCWLVQALTNFCYPNQYQTKHHWMSMVFLWSVLVVALPLEAQSGIGLVAPKAFVHPMDLVVSEINRQSSFVAAIPTLGIVRAAEAPAAMDFVVIGLQVRFYATPSLL